MLLENRAGTFNVYYEYMRSKLFVRTGFFMLVSPKCLSCSGVLVAGDSFCAECGRPTGAIEWSFSHEKQPGKGLVLIQPGERFYLVAQNIGLAPVRVEVNLQRTYGVRLQGIPKSSVGAGQTQAFELHHLEGQSLAGRLFVRSQEKRRQEWWERSRWEEQEFPLVAKVRILEERWVLGSPNLLFPPGVRRQYVRLWNDSEQERNFTSETPIGYQILNFGNPLNQMPVGAGNSGELMAQIRPMGPRETADTEWYAGSEGDTIPFVRLKEPPRAVGADVQVAIDFGTRNTSIRVRWRRTVIASKPEGTVEVVGDRTGSARFPTEMVLHRKESSFRWGSDAADHIDGNRLTPEEVGIENLKTFLREGRDAYIQYNEAWTNEELLGRYFSFIFERLDAYFQTADPQVPLSRHRLGVHYVVTRPVLDANEGDEKGKLYVQTLCRALERNQVDLAHVTFVQEPVAAAIGIARRREKELLGLEGTRVAVIDSGGGTTDVALARVRLAEGSVDLEIESSYALHLTPENPALPALQRFGVQDAEVGGNLLDYAFTHQLLTDATKLLESDDQRPVPHQIAFGTMEATATLETEEEQRRLGRDSLVPCRKLKERFAEVSTLYLNRPRGQVAPEGEVLPFPARSEYEGIFLAGDRFDESLLAPILDPAVETLRDEMQRRGTEAGASGLLPVKTVFYVGGTNINGWVRRRFKQAFPLVSNEKETDKDAQSPERHQERLYAVVEGALWYDERLFPPSPLTLTLQMGVEEAVLITEGESLKPTGMANPEIKTVRLEPQEELEAWLLASGGNLEKPLRVARGFYRNQSEGQQLVTLLVTVSREKGAVAVLQAGDRRLEQWRFVLVEEKA